MIRYVTRWALSAGVYEADGDYTEDGKYFRAHLGSGSIFVGAREAFESLDDAIANAKRRAAKKAASLRKQADKLSDPNWQPKVVRR